MIYRLRMAERSLPMQGNLGVWVGMCSLVVGLLTLSPGGLRYPIAGHLPTSRRSPVAFVPG